MKSSNFTSVTRIKLWLCRILDFILLWIPSFVYVGFAFSNGEVGSTKKIILTGLCAIAIIICVLNFFSQKHKRSPLWLIFIGLYFCIYKLLLPLVLMLAVASILDDFVFAPLISYYKTTLIASKTYDKRKQYDEIEQKAKE